MISRKVEPICAETNCPPTKSMRSEISSNPWRYRVCNPKHRSRVFSGSTTGWIDCSSWLANPTWFGILNFKQDNVGINSVDAGRKKVNPTTHEILLICAPIHAISCVFISTGALAASGQGNGNGGTINVPSETSQLNCFGTSDRTDNVELH